MIAAIACLALVQPYEAEVRAGIPGNASEFYFEDCRIEDWPGGRTVTVQAHARARQNACKWGHCVTLWSYTSRVFGSVLVDGNCDAQDVRIWATPGNPVLEPLFPRIEQGIRGRWSEVKERHSELCP